jgi:alpha-N-acetylglucosamine transferase
MNYVYVNLIYGDDNETFLNTLIFIISLKKTNPKYKIILCHTNDISKNKLKILKKYYYKLIKIDYINVEGIVKERFTKIFTKLEIFKLTQFDKILFLDTDMYVLKNIDHIFSLNTPAAMIISPNLNYKHNQSIIIGNSIINAGFMLLKPNLNDYNKMIQKLKTYNFSDPNLEQKFLSVYFKKWNNISYLYNFQFALIYIEGKRSEIYKKTKFDDIFVIHYSSKKKPYYYMNNKSETYFNFKQFYDKWINQFVKVKKYYLLKQISIENIL